MSNGPHEHPWRRSEQPETKQMAEALWAIAAELREMNRREEDGDT